MRWMSIPLRFISCTSHLGFPCYCGEQLQVLEKKNYCRKIASAITDSLRTLNRGPEGFRDSKSYEALLS